MTWMLDTNACIRYLNGRSAKLRARFDAVDPAQICVSSVVKAELFFGAAMSNDPVTTLAKQRAFLSRFASIAFDDAAAEAYGEDSRRSYAAGRHDRTERFVDCRRVQSTQPDLGNAQL